MKARYNLLFATFFLFHLVAVGQSARKVKTYNVIVTTVYRGQNHKGPLVEVSDSSIVILSKGVRTKVQANTIKTLKFKRKAAVGRGAMIGGLIGFGLGASIGFATAEDSWFTPAENALIGGVVFSGLGSATGVIIGLTSRREKIIINGSRETFVANQHKIRAYLLKPEGVPAFPAFALE